MLFLHLLSTSSQTSEQGSRTTNVLGKTSAEVLPTINMIHFPLTGIEAGFDGIRVSRVLNRKPASNFCLQNERVGQRGRSKAPGNGTVETQSYVLSVQWHRNRTDFSPAHRVRPCRKPFAHSVISMLKSLIRLPKAIFSRLNCLTSTSFISKETCLTRSFSSFKFTSLSTISVDSESYKTFYDMSSVGSFGNFC